MAPQRLTVGRDGLGVHAAADAGVAGAAGLRGLARSLADARRPCRRAAGRGRARLGPARLSAPGAAAARRRHRDRRAPRRRGAGRRSTTCCALPGRRRLHRRRGRSLRVRPARTSCSTPTSAGCFARVIARRAVPAGRGRPRAERDAGRPRCCPPTRRAAAWAVATMELGALVCTARAPRCDECPVADLCRWRAAGYPAYDGPARRGQAWRGTDRQCRGRLMAVLRDATRARAEVGARPRVARCAAARARARRPGRRRSASSRSANGHASRLPDRGRPGRGRQLHRERSARSVATRSWRGLGLVVERPVEEHAVERRVDQARPTAGASAARRHPERCR